jgi:hypothetical protein
MEKSRLIDDRMGGEPLYYLEQPKNISMRISDQVLRCVGFVGVREGTGIQYIGTVFFVSVLQEQMRFSYMVTAKHVADALDGSDCVIRVNNRDGRSVIFEASGVRWWHHPTESVTVDSAVRPLSLEIDHAVATISQTMFATPEIIEEYHIGIGDEVHIAGLFSRVTETAKNQPVVRTGNIAMMPDEKIDFSSIGQIDAYIIETKSFGGLSGCPVFARHTVSTPITEEIGEPPAGRHRRLYGVGSSYLLGSMIGHWVVPKVPKEFDPTLSEAVNMGLSAVVPLYKIQEVLNHPELAEMRHSEIAEESKKRSSTTVLDTAFTVQKTPEGVEIPVPTEDQFLSNLKKASRKIEPKSKA